MKNELVSVLSPCYNVAPYIQRFLNSLIEQTYKNLEIILINDGSTDDTGEIIQLYIPQLQAQGYRVVYVEQENCGVGGTINKGLKLVNGVYLTCPDPDDWLTPDSIERRVKFLREHPEVGVVRGNLKRVDAITETTIGLFEPDIKQAEEVHDMFEKLVFSKTWFAPLTTMLRMSYFDQAVPNREIFYTKRSGQNWQILLPMTAKYPFWQLPEVMGYYLVRQNSHSRALYNYRDFLDYENMCEEVVTTTLHQINAPQSLIRDIHELYATRQFEIIKKSGSWKDYLTYYKKTFHYTKNLRKKIKLTSKIIELFFKKIRALIIKSPKTKKQ